MFPHWHSIGPEFRALMQSISAKNSMSRFHPSRVGRWVAANMLWVTVTEDCGSYKKCDREMATVGLCSMQKVLHM